MALSGICSVIVVAAGPWLLRLWVGGKVVPVCPLLLGLGIWTVLWAIGNALAMFLNGANVVRFQVIIALAMAALAVLLKIVLTQRIGLSGIVWGTVIAFVLAVLLPCVFAVPGELGKLKDRQIVGET